MTIRAKVFLLVLVLAATMAIAIVLSQQALLRDRLIASQDQWIDTLSATLAEAIARGTIDGERLVVGSLLRRIVDQDDAFEYMYVIDFDGHLFAHTFDGGFPEGLVARLTDRAVTPSSDLYFQTGDGVIRETVRPLISGMEASLHIGISNDEIGMLLAESQEESISVIVAISVFCLIGAILIGQRISKPLQDLTRQLYRFGETGAIQKVEVETSDADVHALINEFNRMVDKRVQAESALQRALGDARQANEAKSLFLAAMSHEFRTPLNAIIGFSDILTSQPFGQNDRGKYHEYAKDIHSSGQYLLDLVNDILDLSAIEAGKRALDIRKVEIDTILSDASGVVNRIAEAKNITLTVGPLDRCPPILADGLAIRQILFNLLSNAVKFTPEGGRVDLSVSNSNDQVTFRIVDTGQGIPADKLDTITDPFTKGEHDPYVSAEGWGLGLSITKSLVDLHGGSLTIESTVGSGTTVSVSLPLEPPATPYPAS